MTTSASEAWVSSNSRSELDLMTVFAQKDSSFVVFSVSVQVRLFGREPGVFEETSENRASNVT